MQGAKIVLLSSDAGLAATLEDALVPEGHSLVRVERRDQLLAILEGGTVDVAMIDLASPATPLSGEMHAFHKAAGAAIIVCLSDDCAKARAEMALKSGATKCLSRPPAKRELVAEVRELLEIETHRKELAACEDGAAACPLRKHVHERNHSRVRKRIMVAAVAVIIAALVAVPIVLAIMRSAANTAREADRKLDHIEEIRGYLQRDEQRELESRRR
jgi:DNA-binding response OmpR family regulator